MKIAIDVSPIEGALTGHKVRGVGFYLINLKKALQKELDGDFIFFTDREKISTDVDLIHYPYFEPFFVTLPFFESKKRVITVHDLTPLVFPEHFPAGIKGKLSWQIQRLNLQRSDAIITDSLSSKKDIAKFSGISSQKIHSIYLAAGEEFKQHTNHASTQALLKKYNLPEKYILYVGDVTWNKNLPRLIQAVKQTDIPLVMVGKTLTQKDFDRTNPWNHDLLEVQKATEGDVQFIKLGFVSSEELVALYNVATAAVMPSIYEGFGLPILEAMQSGCPVITTKLGSLPEVAGEAAYYVEGFSSESITKGIVAVFTNAKLQKELSEKGIKQAKKFSWEKTAQETIAIYKKILGVNK